MFLLMSSGFVNIMMMVCLLYIRSEYTGQAPAASLGLIGA
jgi:hypothetical protein